MRNKVKEMAAKMNEQKRMIVRISIGIAVFVGL